MSEEAIKFKKINKDLNYQQMSLGELSRLPVHNGILEFKISKCSFLILNILNDDSSAVKFFWKDSHDLVALDLWYNMCREEGIYIDVGAHTGLYTITALKANEKNKIICFEPYYLNMARLVTNLRLNSINLNVENILSAVSNFSGRSKFMVGTEKSYLSKGGRINKKGISVDIVKLDTFVGNHTKPIRGIKIDTEGEDLNVLQGSEEIISIHKPKIIVEVREDNKTDIYNFLKKNNYNMFDINNLKKPIDLTNFRIDKVVNVLALPIL